MKYDVIYAVSTTRWVVVPVEAEYGLAAEAAVRASPPDMSCAKTGECLRVIAYPEGSILAKARQTNLGPVFDDGSGI